MDVCLWNVSVCLYGVYIWCIYDSIEICMDVYGSIEICIDVSKYYLYIYVCICNV